MVTQEINWIIQSVSIYKQYHQMSQETVAFTPSIQKIMLCQDSAPLVVSTYVIIRYCQLREDTVIISSQGSISSFVSRYSIIVKVYKHNLQTLQEHKIAIINVITLHFLEKFQPYRVPTEIAPYVCPHVKTQNILHELS